MAQSLARLLVHLVFSTKDRMPLIRPEIETDLYAYMGGTLKQLECVPILIGGTEDHVHVLFALSRGRAVSEVVEKLKTASSKMVKTRGPAYLGFHWQAGYGAFTIGESGIPALKGYIAGQKEHHRRVSFQDELRAFLQKYNVPFQEEYVWG